MSSLIVFNAYEIKIRNVHCDVKVTAKLCTVQRQTRDGCQLKTIVLVCCFNTFTKR